jgi:hypothetical protein
MCFLPYIPTCSPSSMSASLGPFSRSVRFPTSGSSDPSMTSSIGLNGGNHEAFGRHAGKGLLQLQTFRIVEHLGEQYEWSVAS